MSKKMNFFEKAKEIHGDKYDYSLIEYKNNSSKVKIICKIHGVFEQTPNSHISKKCGCPKCVGKNKDFIIDVVPKLRIIHNNKYDYSKSIYKSVDDKIIITCYHHGDYEQVVYSHLSGHGCPKCRSENLSLKYRDNRESFISKAIKKHGEKYDYSNVIYINTKNKVDIFCYKHGVFKQLPHSHLQGKGCPICKESKGETIIRKFLLENKILFETQKRFGDCRDKRPLPFDFFLPYYNCCIEFDGKQHEGFANGWFGNKEPNKCYNLLLKHDEIKTDYCEKNKIKLIRVNYQDSITDIIKKFKGLLSIEENNNIKTAKIY
jgi:Zn finger protein HypA/HybF involved in hydrogenase expression